MKSFALLALTASPALGHCKTNTPMAAKLFSGLTKLVDFFPNTIVDGVNSDNWEFIRETANNPGSGPIEDVSSSLMACYEKSGRPASAVQTIAAGSSIGFHSSASMGHPGPSLFYMARVPDGEDIDSWSPTGNVWFKIDEYGNVPGVYPPFETEMASISTTIPSSLSSGSYLVRAEHVALHIPGAPQFYIACAQVEVTGGGSATPSDLVSFPGAYSLSDPGLAFDIYAENGEYPYPGPAVFA